MSWAWELKDDLDRNSIGKPVIMEEFGLVGYDNQTR